MFSLWNYFHISYLDTEFVTELLYWKRKWLVGQSCGYPDFSLVIGSWAWELRVTLLNRTMIENNSKQRQWNISWFSPSFQWDKWRGCLQQFSALGWAPCNNSNHINMRMPEPIPTTGYLRRTNTSWQHSPCWTVENDVRESWCFKIRWHTGKKWPPNGLYSNSKFSCLANLYVTAIVKIQDTNMWLNKIPILTGVLQ